MHLKFESRAGPSFDDDEMSAAFSIAMRSPGGNSSISGEMEGPSWTPVKGLRDELPSP